MKKIITKILSLVLTVALSIGFLGGCDLITTNVEADMAQTIASVQLEGMNKEDVKKSQLVAAFNTSGYLYVYYYGYSEEQVYEQLLEELVNNRIIVQQAKLAFTGATTALRNEKGYFLSAKEETNKTSIDEVLSLTNYKGEDFTGVDKNDSVENFLAEYEYHLARYNAVKNIDSLLESYKDVEEEEHDHNHESISATVRATLTKETEETPNVWEIKNDPEFNAIDEDYIKSFKKDLTKLNLNASDYATKYDLSFAVYKKYVEEYDLTDKETKKALNKLLKDLKKNGLISSKEASKDTPKTIDELFNLSYFDYRLEGEYESILVAKLEMALQNQEEKKVDSVDKLYQEYVSLYNTQKASYDKDYTAYETALENASGTSFVVYNPVLNGNYGYISNLLIGFNTEQSNALSNFSESVIGEKEEYRSSLLNDLTAKDQRETWAISNYGTYNEETKVFTFGDDYVKTPELKNYVGKLSGATSYIEHDSYDEEITKYNFKAVEGTEVKFTEFYADTVSAIMGFTGMSGKLLGVEEETIISKTINDETMTKFRDLIYAYSTDSGSLAENYGYVYSPVTSKSTSVKEFANAAERLVNLGVGAYEVVATDFGYHIMLCTSVITSGNALASKEAFLNDVSKEGTLAYNFKEYKYNLISSSTISEITNTIVNTFKNDESKVTYFKKAYEDLIPETEE